ncbi:unnamed protein product [Closterium sp. Yama58-4]|nr:unnamed protein product [Closterium sp. Yama58-4]
MGNNVHGMGAHGPLNPHKVTFESTQKSASPTPAPSPLLIPPGCPLTATLQWWAALMGNNVHGMGAHGPLNTDTALGLFPFVSMLNHSCRPNCCFASQGNTMVVRATSHIDKGTELCVSYINLYESRESRQQQLLDSKHFICACDRCSEPLALSSDRLLERDSKACLAALSSFQSTYSKTLHPRHVLLFDSLTPALNCARALSDYTQAMRHALALVDGLSTVAPSAVLEAANFAHAASELAALRAASAAPALEHRLTKQVRCGCGFVGMRECGGVRL